MTPTKTWLLGTLALLLTACPATPAPGPQPVTSVSGTVVVGTPTGTGGVTTAPWVDGAGTVTGTFPGASTPAVTTPMSADGAFTLTLPAPSSASLMPFNQQEFITSNLFLVYILSAGQAACSGSPTVSAAAVSMTGLNLRATGKSVSADISQDLQSNVVTSDSSTTTTVSDGRQGFLLYVDAPLNITGKTTCSASDPTQAFDGTITYDLRLTRGWNKVTQRMELKSVETTSDTGPTGSVTLTQSITSGALPSAVWVAQTGSAPTALKLRPPALFPR